MPAAFLREPYFDQGNKLGQHARSLRQSYPVQHQCSRHPSLAYEHSSNPDAGHCDLRTPEFSAKMAEARTPPSEPPRLAPFSFWSPAPAATSKTWLPGLTPVMSSMRSVADPSHCCRVGAQSCHA